MFSYLCVCINTGKCFSCLQKIKIIFGCKSKTSAITLFNSSHPELLYEKVALQLYWNHTSTWLFSCKFAAYFQNTFSQEHLWTAASYCFYLTFFLFKVMLENDKWVEYLLLVNIVLQFAGDRALLAFFVIMWIFINVWRLILCN